MTPSGIINICANTNMKYQSEDTIYFATKQAKRDYFASKVIKTFTDQQYTRSTTNGVNSTLNGKLYVSPGTASIKVDCPISQIYNADYMYFLNQNYENKYFYCFITDVSYVSDNVTQITFTEDVFMTWQNDISLQHCFVERETTSSDNVFEHKILENVIQTEPKTYRKEYLKNTHTTQPYRELESLQASYIVLAVKRLMVYDNSSLTDDAQAITVSGQTYMIPQRENVTVAGGSFNARFIEPYLSNVNGTPLPYAYYVFPLTTAGFTKAQNVIYTYSAVTYLKSEDIIGGFLAPSFALPTDLVNDHINNGTSSFILMNEATYKIFTSICVNTSAIGQHLYMLPNNNLVVGSLYYKQFETTASNGIFEGYVPKNKKLYNAPFHDIVIDNGSGESITLRPELVDAHIDANNKYSLQLNVGAIFDTSVEVDLMVPYNGNDMFANLLSYETYPSFPWNSSSFTEWKALYGDYTNAKTALQIVSGAINVGTGIASGVTAKTGGGVAGGVNQAGQGAVQIGNAIADGIQTWKEQKANSPKSHGTLKGNLLRVLYKTEGFIISHRSYRAEDAERVDAYFTRYGYIVKKFKAITLGLNGRKRFYYVRTSECNVTGDAPMYAKNFIGDRFNQGVRMWSSQYFLVNEEDNPLL